MTLVRLRGRVKRKKAIAWLEVKGSRSCSTNDASFVLVTSDGREVHVVIAEDTQWKTWLRGGYAGPWKSIDDDVTDNPFRDRRDIDGEDIVHFHSVDLDETLDLEVWGVPELGPGSGEGSYREAKGEIVRVTATRISRWYERDIETPWGAYALVLVALVLAALAPFGAYLFALGRIALLVGLVGIRWLHREASQFRALERSSAGVLEIVQFPLWGYIVLGYVLPLDVSWIRLGAALVLAGVCTRWAVLARRNARAVYDALLSPKAVEGILDNGSIRAEGMSIAYGDVTVRWLEDGSAGGEHVTIAPAGEKNRWIVVESVRPSVRPLLEKGRRWDGVMPAVYLGFVIATLALAWPRF